MSGALIVYALVSLMVLLISLMVLDTERRARERRNAARCALLFWAWPLLLAWGSIIGVTHLIRAADLNNGRKWRG